MEQRLVAVMNTVAETLTCPITLDEALDRITRGAADTVPGIEQGSISLTAHGGLIQPGPPIGPGSAAMVVLPLRSRGRSSSSDGMPADE